MSFMFAIGSCCCVSNGCFLYKNDLSGGMDDWTTEGDFALTPIVFSPGNAPSPPNTYDSLNVRVDMLGSTGGLVIWKDASNYLRLRITTTSAKLYALIGGVEIDADISKDEWDDSEWHTITLCQAPATTLATRDGELLFDEFLITDGMTSLSDFTNAGVDSSGGASYRNFIVRQVKDTTNELCPSCTQGEEWDGECSNQLPFFGEELVLDLTDVTFQVPGIPEFDCPDCAETGNQKFPLRQIPGIIAVPPEVPPFSGLSGCMYGYCQTLCGDKQLRIFAVYSKVESFYFGGLFGSVDSLSGDRANWYVSIQLPDGGAIYVTAGPDLPLAFNDDLSGWNLTLGSPTFTFPAACFVASWPSTMRLSRPEEASPDVDWQDVCLGTGGDPAEQVALFALCCIEQSAFIGWYMTATSVDAASGLTPGDVVRLSNLRCYQYLGNSTGFLYLLADGMSILDTWADCPTCRQTCVCCATGNYIDHVEIYFPTFTTDNGFNTVRDAYNAIFPSLPFPAWALPHPLVECSFDYTSPPFAYSAGGDLGSSGSAIFTASIAIAHFDASFPDPAYCLLEIDWTIEDVLGGTYFSGVYQFKVIDSIGVNCLSGDYPSLDRTDPTDATLPAHWHLGLKGYICTNIADRTVLEGREVSKSAPGKLKDTSCIHRGAEIETRECETCCGNTQIKVFSCALHGQCSYEKDVGAKVCAQCKDRSPVVVEIKPGG
jgi:hypothetical protein